MAFEDFEETVKFVVVGDGRVGKTSLITRFADGIFTAQYKKTIGVNFLEKEYYSEDLDTTYRLHLWDTAGQEEFNALTQSYYRGASAAMVVFSITDPDSFEHVESWVSRVRDSAGDVPIIIVCNKMDLESEGQVSIAQAERLCSTLGLELFQMSVKDNVGLDEAFLRLLMLCYAPERCGLLDDSHDSSSLTTSSRRSALASADDLAAVKKAQQVSRKGTDGLSDDHTANREITAEYFREREAQMAQESWWSRLCILV